ncbi:fluoride efflux transporter FluC [Cohnella cellulosilytica]|uniref:Fluoride-specific ion channel FluC n=1 Tax=Cohnella cellulosilytica TaxID=986710 RepID=A0ABW2FE50_9BACL
MRIVLGVALAGFLGALARYGIGFLIPASGAPAAFPWATVFINLSGSLLLGLLTGWLMGRPALAWAGDVLGTGFLGAYTTFSAFNGQLWQMLEHRAYGVAGVYVLVSAAAGWALAALGLTLGRRRMKQA